VYVNILRNQEVSFLISSHTLLYTKIYINTMKPLQLNCRRTISSSILPKIVFSPIFSNGLGKFFVNSPSLVAYPAAITMSFILHNYQLSKNLAPSSGFTQNTLNVFSYSENCSRYFSVSTF